MSEKNAKSEIILSVEDYERLLAAAKTNIDDGENNHDKSAVAAYGRDVIDSAEANSEEKTAKDNEDDERLADDTSTDDEDVGSDVLEDDESDPILADDTALEDEDSTNLPAIISDDNEKALSPADIEIGKKLMAAASKIAQKIVAAITENSPTPLADIDARDLKTFFQAAQSQNGGELMAGILDAVYGHAANGVPGVIASIKELAEKYRDDGDTISEQIDSLIKWQWRDSALKGLDSGATGPAAIIFDGGKTLCTQVRMVGAIAYLRGYDINDAKVKAMIFACLLGNNVSQIAGKKVAVFIKNLTKKTAEKIIKRVCAKLGARMGAQGMKKLGSAVVPVIGSVVGSAIGMTFDAVTTKAVGNAAKLVFAPQGEELAEIKRAQAAKKAAEEAEKAAKAEAKRKEEEARKAAMGETRRKIEDATEAVKADVIRRAEETKEAAIAGVQKKTEDAKQAFTKLKGFFKR